MKTLYAEDVPGLTLKAIYAVHAAHRIYYIVEADSYGAIAGFLEPGMLRCTAEITPIGQAPIKELPE